MQRPGVGRAQNTEHREQFSVLRLPFSESENGERKTENALILGVVVSEPAAFRRPGEKELDKEGGDSEYHDDAEYQVPGHGVAVSPIGSATVG